jgi:hypothetical protein
MKPGIKTGNKPEMNRRKPKFRTLKRPKCATPFVFSRKLNDILNTTGWKQFNKNITKRFRSGGGGNDNIAATKPIKYDISGEFNYDFWFKKFDDEYNIPPLPEPPKNRSRSSRGKSRPPPPPPPPPLPQNHLENFKSLIESIYKSKEQSNEFCKFIQRIIPKYETVRKDITKTYHPKELCLLTFLIGIFTHMLRKECNIFTKGGKAVEIELSKIEENDDTKKHLGAIEPYQSNDIDIMIYISNNNYTERDIANQIAKFILWVTNFEGGPKFITKDFPKYEADEKTLANGSIVKISYKEEWGEMVAMVDIGYVSTTPFFDRSEPFSEWVISAPGSNRVFTFNGYNLYYNTQTIEKMIVERLYYINLYTTDTASKQNPAFMDSLKRSTNALLHGLMVKVLSNKDEYYIKYDGENYELDKEKVEKSKDGDIASYKKHIVETLLSIEHTIDKKTIDSNRVFSFLEDKTEKIENVL